MFEKWNFLLYYMYIGKKVSVKDHGMQFDKPSTDLNLTGEKNLIIIYFTKLYLRKHNICLYIY